MFYSYRQIDSYNAPINVILGQRGIGKTFTAVLKGIRGYMKHKSMFIYVVETKEMVKTLAQDNGSKFFKAIMTFVETTPSRSNKALEDFLFNAIVEGDDAEDKVKSLIRGGAIKVGGDTIGYIVAFNDFADLKRNNFDGVGHIVIDEFIPEKRDITILKNPYKIVNLIQSVCRLRDVKVYLLGNTINMNDPVLDAFGLCDLRVGELRQLKDKHGLLAVAHRIDPSEYQEYTDKLDASVAGRLATFMGQDELDKNVFKNAIDTNLLIGKNKLASNHAWTIVGPNNISVDIRSTKGYGVWYVTAPMSKSKKIKHCCDIKQSNNNVLYNKDLRADMLTMFEMGMLKFDTSMTYMNFKLILKLEIE